jgi:hypothetical protein
MAMNFGPPEKLTDDELREAVTFWRGKLREYVQTGEPDYVAQGREQVEKVEAEARKRGLI